MIETLLVILCETNLAFYVCIRVCLCVFVCVYVYVFVCARIVLLKSLFEIYSKVKKC